MSLIRSAATVGGMTMVSRVLGFMRDILIAQALGTGPVADAFFVAFRFPNLFRRLFAEGAFNSAFVPLYAKRLEGEGANAARRFAEEALSVLFTALIILTALAEIAMPWLMVVIAPGFIDDAAKFDMAVLFTRIAFPYLLLMSLVALLSAVLNSLGRFTAAAAAPILLNIILIAALLLIVPLFSDVTANVGLILSWGVAVAGAAQLIMLLWAAGRAGVHLHLRVPRLTQGVRRLVRLGVPGLIAGGATQFNLLVSGIIASLQAGAVSYLYYADRIYQLPLGVVGIAIGIVLLPDLSRRLRKGDESGAHWSQNRACEFGMLLTVPAAIALVAIPGPIIHVLFERGAFGAQDTTSTAAALAAFAAGLPAFVLIKVWSPGFFAREDTMTPMIYTGIGIAVNIIGALLLFLVIGHVGIALATTLAAWVTAGLLGLRLARDGHFKPDQRLKRRVPLIGLCAGVMGAALWAGASLFAAALADGATGVMALVLLVGGGAALFAAACQITGAARLGELRTAFGRK